MFLSCTFAYPSTINIMDASEKHIVDHASSNDGGSTDPPPVAEVRADEVLLRKCDLRLLPPLMVIFFLSNMDRTNIGLPPP